MAALTYAELENEARRQLGKTDPAKGGADSATYRRLVNKVTTELCVEGEAPRSTFFFDIAGGDAYVPLPREVLWIEHLRYTPVAGGVSRFLALADGPPSTPTVGDPNIWWWTAVNVPDVNGPSTRHIAINPVPASDVVDGLEGEVFQIARDMAADGDTPEIHDACDFAIVAGVCLKILPAYKDKMHLEAYFRREWARGVQLFKKIYAGGKKQPVRVHDAMAYGRRLRSRIR